MYRGRDDFTVGIIEIFIALAANSLNQISKHRRTHASPSLHNNVNGNISTDMDVAASDPVFSDLAKKALEYISRADTEMRFNEYTWLVKGFYEVLCSGE